jgi:hypothetical protein
VFINFALKKQKWRKKKKMCPLTKTEPRTKLPDKITPQEFEKGVVATFLNDGIDITTQNGLQYLYVVTLIANPKEERSIWIKPNSSRAIAFSPHVPLKDKTFKISKSGIGQGTRFVVEEVVKSTKRS